MTVYYNISNYEETILYNINNLHVSILKTYMQCIILLVILVPLPSKVIVLRLNNYFLVMYLLFSHDLLVTLPGMDLPSSRYSLTEGLRNPGGTEGCFGGPFLSSNSCSGPLSRSGMDGARGLFMRGPSSSPSANGSLDCFELYGIY